MTSKVKYNFGQEDIQRVDPQKKKQRYDKRDRDNEDDFTRGSSKFRFLMQQKFPRMS